MASYRAYRSASNYRKRNVAKGSSPTLNYDDPYVRWQMSSMPVVGSTLRAMDQEKYYRDYFRNTGLSWKDVRYPALLSGAGLGGGLSDSAGQLGMLGAIRRLYRH